MANHCDNRVVIFFSEKDIKQQKHIFVRKIFEFFNINSDYEEMPYYNILISKKDTIPSTILNTFTHSFGSKWIEDVCINSDTSDISFTSAWAPPLGLTHLISYHFKLKIEHEYSEPGCDFGGVAHFDKGFISDEEYSYMEYLRIYQTDTYREELQYHWNNRDESETELDFMEEYNLSVETFERIIKNN